MRRIIGGTPLSAAQAYQQVLAEAKQQGALDRNPAQVARVQNILKRLIPATAAFRPDAPKRPWEIHVLSSKEVNAHALREHSRERASQSMAQQVAVGIIGAVAGIPGGLMDLAPMVLDLTFNLPLYQAAKSGGSASAGR